MNARVYIIKRQTLAKKSSHSRRSSYRLEEEERREGFQGKINKNSSLPQYEPIDLFGCDVVCLN